MTMNREQLSELLSAYVDGEVTASEKVAVESVLRSDPHARQLLEEFKRTAAAVSGLPHHAAPASLAVDLDTQLERAQLLSGFGRGGERTSRWGRWQTPMRAAAMLAIVCGAGWWFVLRPGTTTQGDKVVDATRSLGREEPVIIDAAIPVTAERDSAKDVESRLAAGEDPVVLVSQSFEPEPIRLTVTANDNAERDALARQFTTQLASAHAENLANRKASSARKDQSMGSFYLEGKPGVNYKSSRERQILVRLPVEQAQAIIDGVSDGVRSPQDQIAFQAGPVRAQGAEKTQRLIGLLAQKDDSEVPAIDKKADLDDAVAKKSANVALVDTLGEIVGLGPIAAKSATPVKPEEGAETMSDAKVSAERVAAADANELKKENPPSMVEKGFERARSSRSPSAASPSSLATSTSPERAAGATAASQQFVTMVVEFTTPKPKESIRSR